MVLYICRKLMIDKKMINVDFWASIEKIINSGFQPDGLLKLDEYAELFSTRGLLYKRFSPKEQHGCSEGGPIHVIATLLAGAEDRADSIPSSISDFKRQCKRAEKQAETIELWAKSIDVWIDNVDEKLAQSLGAYIADGGEALVYDGGSKLIKVIGLDYFIEPILALDRISLHNAYFPETKMTVSAFGRTAGGEFKIIVEQQFIKGNQISIETIEKFVQKMGFKLINPRNWTYATPEIYLSDLHDENVIQSDKGNVFVIDCDIRINVPELKCGGIRKYSTEVELVNVL
jgi:hypothetical protein